MRYLLIDLNQTDARYKKTDICQSLKARMGTGGGNVPLVVEMHEEDRDGNLYGEEIFQMGKG